MEPMFLPDVEAHPKPGPYIDAAKGAGWSEEALYDAITVCALFNFYNTWIDATGVSDLPPEAYADPITQMKAAGVPVPQIMHLFAYKPERTEFLARFTQGVMRGPSPLSPGIRELIAAFTSRRNECPF